MKNKQLIIISTILAIAILGVGYMNYAFRLKVFNQEQKDKLRMETIYTECVTAVFADYELGWNSYCEASELKEDCDLPVHKAQVLNETLKTDKTDCMKLLN